MFIFSIAPVRLKFVHFFQGPHGDNGHPGPKGGKGLKVKKSVKCINTYTDTHKHIYSCT